ncbi:MAG TPA: hypothetical protein VHX14_06520 [Thermoanaerobaculia bacterium]|nr:hypothetical protein [Thermoanaerobaculia bacterium]
MQERDRQARVNVYSISAGGGSRRRPPPAALDRGHDDVEIALVKAGDRVVAAGEEAETEADFKKLRAELRRRSPRAPVLMDF